MQLIKIKWVDVKKTRKNHTCVACEAKILKGSGAIVEMCIHKTDKEALEAARAYGIKEEDTFKTFNYFCGPVCRLEYESGNDDSENCYSPKSKVDEYLDHMSGVRQHWN